ncbi:hypothetical protein FIBSPDRAFT_879759 [Athelia psychrophila]|uniref:Uncharacterized protein n=1 Tax=Athelia psychrophila TaxID=1759441 RepID=A0A167TLX0_9AGAM|nr:hypothetical protein FIBSPDRAFT_879759 [Fibularhizoctonia sp. CBS 109695]
MPQSPSETLFVVISVFVALFCAAIVLAPGIQVLIWLFELVSLFAELSILSLYNLLYALETLTGITYMPFTVSLMLLVCLFMYGTRFWVAEPRHRV